MPNLPNSSLISQGESDKRDSEAHTVEALEFYDLRERIDPMIGTYFPTLMGCVHAMLAVFGAMALADRTRPLSLIYEGPSGSGKTTVVEMAFPLPDSSLNKYVYRTDKFTPKAFVTHAANKKQSELAKIDLLPKLHGRVLLTKELAPIFRGREQDMQENFSTLIGVLDGKGFLSDTGMQGQRGYGRKIMFNWIGATTPLPARVHRLMSQLGTRLLFFEVPSTSPSDSDLLAFAKNQQPSLCEVECNKIINEFLERFFQRHPVGSVPHASISFTDEQMMRLVRLAKFLAKGRAELVSEKGNGSNWKAVAAMAPEGAHKIVNYLKDLAFGHALVSGRMHLDTEDLDLVEEVAISSIPRPLRQIIRYLRAYPTITTPTVSALCRTSAPTARSYMNQLVLLGIGALTSDSPKTSEPNCITLAAEFHWLRRFVEI